MAGFRGFSVRRARRPTPRRARNFPPLSRPSALAAAMRRWPIIARFFSLEMARAGRVRPCSTRDLRPRVPTCWRNSPASKAALLGLREKIKAAEAAERSLALSLVVNAILDRYDSIKAERQILDFEDLIARTRGNVPALVGALGAAKARRRDRAYSGRRSAGHQRRAMGDSRPHFRGFFRRRGPGAPPAQFFCGGRRKAVDLFVPGRRAKAFRGQAGRIRETRASRAKTVRPRSN